MPCAIEIKRYLYDSMKKLLIIQESLSGGGAERVLCNILNRFDYRHYHVTLLLWYKSGIYLDRIPENVKVLGISEDESSLLGRILFRLPMPFGDYVIRKLLKITGINGHYDVMISFLEGISARVHNILRKRGETNISWVHTDMEKNRWSDKYFSYHHAEKFYSGINDVVFVSNGAKEAFERVFKTSSRHRVIYNIQQPDEIRRLGDEPLEMSNVKGRFTVCCVGRLVRQKRFDRVIRIAAILKSRGYDVLFRIVGEGILRNELESLAKEYGVTDMVEFAGFQSNPYKYMKSSDIFLSTSESEGLPLVVAEALILGKPVVSTRVTGSTELLDNGVGILCDEDENKIAKAIMTLYDNRELVSQYTLSALNRSHIFNPEETMKKIYSLI